MFMMAILTFSDQRVQDRILLQPKDLKKGKNDIKYEQFYGLMLLMSPDMQW